MLKSLVLKGVGPAERLAMHFPPRMTFLTGDNGLGKSFMLDLAWWSLTQTWARGVAASPRADSAEATIAAEFANPALAPAFSAHFSYREQRWLTDSSRPDEAAIVIYAGVDGSFSIWDSVRNVPQRHRLDHSQAFDFSPDAVWNGLQDPHSKAQMCNGLIHDWVLWQAGNQPAFNDLIKVLNSLSPSHSETIRPGAPMRLGESVRDIPSLAMPYGEDVPLPLASAALKRICALAYLLVWTWREHQLACDRYRVTPASQVVFLIDEIECHLHPQWQRRIVPALLGVMNALTGSHRLNIQMIAATHSPLVLASTEPLFDTRLDCIWDFGLTDGKVVASPYDFHRLGDVNSWLASEVFNLKEPASVEAEQAMEQARAFLKTARQATLSESQNQQLHTIDQALRASLSDVDAFWIRWSQFRDQHKPNT